MEHPVTEWIAEINLPAAQVVVGMGIPLWQIPGLFQNLYYQNLIVLIETYDSIFLLINIRDTTILWSGTWWRI